MIYKGVEYIAMSTTRPDIWRWQFKIGNEVKTGQTETKLALLAMRRVEAQIDRALRNLRDRAPNV